MSQLPLTACLVIFLVAFNLLKQSIQNPFRILSFPPCGLVFSFSPLCQFTSPWPNMSTQTFCSSQKMIFTLEQNCGARHTRVGVSRTGYKKILPPILAPGTALLLRSLEQKGHLGDRAGGSLHHTNPVECWRPDCFWRHRRLRAPAQLMCSCN